MTALQVVSASSTPRAILVWNPQTLPWESSKGTGFHESRVANTPRTLGGKNEPFSRDHLWALRSGLRLGFPGMESNNQRPRDLPTLQERFFK